jgi:hypothetical protein
LISGIIEIMGMRSRWAHPHVVSSRPPGVADHGRDLVAYAEVSGNIFSPDLQISLRYTLEERSAVAREIVKGRGSPVWSGLLGDGAPRPSSDVFLNIPLYVKVLSTILMAVTA